MNFPLGMRRTSNNRAEINEFIGFVVDKGA